MIPGESLHLAHLGPDEVGFLGRLSAALSLDDSGTDALWLRVAPGGRWWLLETPDGRITYRVESPAPSDASPDPRVQRWLPIPERIMRVAVSGGSESDDHAVLSLVDNTTAVVTCPQTSGGVDLVTGVGPPTDHTWIESAEISVPADRLAALLWSAFAVPNAVLEQRLRPYPPMWLRLDEDGITFHVDWADARSGRSTYRCEAEFHGEAITVPIFPNSLHAFLHQVVYQSFHEVSSMHCTVAVGAVEFDDDTHTRRAAVEVRYGDATLTVWVTDPLVDRWGSEVTAAIAAADVELIGHEDSEWLLRSFGVDVRITLHHGHPDHIRLSAVVCSGLHETVEVLREVNQINGVSVGPRFVVADGTIHAMADIACTERPSITPALTRAIDELVTATRRYAPLLSVLTTG